MTKFSLAKKKLSEEENQIFYTYIVYIYIHVGLEPCVLGQDQVWA